MIEIRDLRMGTPAPNFRLQSNRDKDIELRDYRHRQPVVIFLMHGSQCPDCLARLQQFATVYNEYQFWKTEVLAITSEARDQDGETLAALHLPFPILFDPKRQVWDLYALGSNLGILVLDRWNGLQRRQAEPEATNLMSPLDALSWVEQSEIACPECGVNEWRES